MQKLAAALFPDTSAPISQVASLSTEATERIHVVKKGESLWKIAQAEYSDGFAAFEIAKNNNLANPDVIQEGQNLLLP